jgi:hypothetical protein
MPEATPNFARKQTLKNEDFAVPASPDFVELPLEFGVKRSKSGGINVVFNGN